MLNINVTIIYQFRIVWFTFIPPKYINHIACHNLNLLHDNPHNNNVVRIKSSHSNHSITALIYSISFSMVMLLLS